MSARTVSLCCIVLCVAAASASAAEPAFYGVGDLPGGDTGSYAFAVSSDGSAVVGGSYSGYSQRQAFLWTVAGGMVPLGTGRGNSFGYAVADGGATVVGSTWAGSVSEAFRWTEATGLVGLGFLEDGKTYSNAYAVSADGAVVVGDCKMPIGNEAFRWTPGGGMQGLGMLPAGTSSYAYAMTPDATVFVGASSTPAGLLAFRRTDDMGMVSLGSLSTYSRDSVARGVSADGDTVVGRSWNGTRYESFRWTEETGMVGLGQLPGHAGDSNEAYGVSGDGSIVVGVHSMPGQVAYIWDEAHGMRILQDVLEDDYGLDLTGWSLKEAKAISADGRTIVGYGVNPLGRDEGWVVVLPEPATLSLLAAGLSALLMRRRRARA